MFEFDTWKSQINHDKHGIDFLTAQLIWNDPDHVEIPAKIVGERRFMVIGKINDKHWTAVITYRRLNIRIISVRRARADEVRLYEN